MKYDDIKDVFSFELDFDSEEEERKYRELAEKIEYIPGIIRNNVSFKNCKFEPSKLFVDKFGKDEAWYIITLVCLKL